MAKNQPLIAQYTPDGMAVECSWPDDPFEAQELFNALEYELKKAFLASAKASRDKQAVDAMALERMVQQVRNEKQS